MFSLRPAAVRIVSLYTVAVMGVVMGVVMYLCTRYQPAFYAAHQEVFNFALTAIAMLAISQLSGQLMDMRTRLKTQKIALEQALAHIKDMATRHARGGPRFYVCIIDLDHFKNINDTYGHAAGDAVLRAFAAQAQVVLRTTDIIGRWGGEEFLLLLQETPPGEPTLGVARLRESLEDRPASAALPDQRIRFSAGFARYGDGETDRPGHRTRRPRAVRSEVGGTQPQRRALRPGPPSVSAVALGRAVRRCVAAGAAHDGGLVKLVQLARHQRQAEQQCDERYHHRQRQSQEPLCFHDTSRSLVDCPALCRRKNVLCH